MNAIIQLTAWGIKQLVQNYIISWFYLATQNIILTFTICYKTRWLHMSSYLVTFILFF